jgi:hypothetical protein
MKERDELLPSKVRAEVHRCSLDFSPCSDSWCACIVWPFGLFGMNALSAVV